MGLHTKVGQESPEERYHRQVEALRKGNIRKVLEIAEEARKDVSEIWNGRLF